MKEITEDDIILQLDELIRQRSFEGDSVMDGKMEFLMFWAFHARVPIPEEVGSCYWAGTIWIQPPAFAEFIQQLKKNPKGLEHSEEWSYYIEELELSEFLTFYNEMLCKGVIAEYKYFYDRVKRVINFTHRYLETKNKIKINDEQLKEYLEKYLLSKVFQQTCLFIRELSDRRKKSKIKNGFHLEND